MDGRPSFNSVGQKQLSDDGKEYKLAKGDMEKMKERELIESKIKWVGIKKKDV